MWKFDNETTYSSWISWSNVYQGNRKANCLELEETHFFRVKQRRLVSQNKKSIGITLNDCIETLSDLSNN